MYPNVKTRFPLVCAALDSETLALREDAVVTEVAVVKFRLDVGPTGRLQRETLDSKVFYFNAIEQVALGRVIDKDTFDFHVQHGGLEAISSQVIPGLANPDSKHILKQLQDFCVNAEEVWINGLSFDPSVLRSLATTYGFKTKYHLNSFWHYHKERDCRTVYRTFPMEKPEGSSSHRALEDAQWVERIVHLYHQGVQDYLYYLQARAEASVAKVQTVGDSSANNGGPSVPSAS